MMYRLGSIIIGCYLTSTGEVVPVDGPCLSEQWQGPSLAQSYELLGIEGLMIIPLHWHVASNKSNDYPSLTVQSPNGVVMQVLATSGEQSLSEFVRGWVEHYKQNGFSEQVEVKIKSLCIKGVPRPTYVVKITDNELEGREKVELLEMEAEGRQVFITIWSTDDALASRREMRGLLQASRLN